MTSPTFAFAGVCKNIESNISHIKRLKIELECPFFIVENNSTDRTQDLLISWAATDPTCFVKVETIPNDVLLGLCRAKTWDNKPCRMECIAMARNKLVNMVKNSNLFKTLDYIVMIDLDNPNPFPVESFLKYLKEMAKLNLDAMICNGGPDPSFQYDAYAFRNDTFPFGPEVIGEIFWRDIHNISAAVNTVEPFIDVVSAFNGCCVFKKTAFSELEYSGIVTAEVDRYYRKYKDTLGKIKAETHKNGTLLGCYEFGTDGIWYYFNSGYNQAVICEHLHAFCRLREKGFSKIKLAKDLWWKW